MFGGPYTVLPKEFNLAQQAVPTVAADVTTVDTELALVSVTNTTAGTLTMTIQDRQNPADQTLNAINVDPNSVCLLPYDPPVYLKGGLNWVASGAGLVATLRGRTVDGLTQGTDSNGNKIPV